MVGEGLASCAAHPESNCREVAPREHRSADSEYTAGSITPLGATWRAKPPGTWHNRWKPPVRKSTSVLEQHAHTSPAGRPLRRRPPNFGRRERRAVLLLIQAN